MMPEQDDVGTAVENFLGSWNTPEGDAPQPEAQPEGGEAAPAEPVSTEVTDPAEGRDSQNGTQGAPEGQPEEIPDFVRKAVENRNYYGVDLSDLSDETAQKLVLDLHEKWTKPVNKLQQKNAQLREQVGNRPNITSDQDVEADQLDFEVSPQDMSPAQQEPQGEPEMREPTDDELLQHYGYDLDDPMLETLKPYVLPMVKRQFATDSALFEAAQEAQTEEVFNHWMDTLDEMEAEHGTLPITREELVAEALKNGWDDPEVAYIKVTAPYRKATNEAVRGLRTAPPVQAEPQKPNTQRPQGLQPGVSTDPIPLRDAVKEGAEKASDGDFENFMAGLLSEM